jgi:hypothetical protein
MQGRAGGNGGMSEVGDAVQSAHRIGRLPVLGHVVIVTDGLQDSEGREEQKGGA